MATDEIETITPEETQSRLLQGSVYVDVRTPEEFAEGHAPGSLNVPWMFKGPSGMTPNPEFEAVMKRAFGTSEPLVVACRSGRRSRAAAEHLVAAGFERVADMTAGWVGPDDSTPGWSLKGLPVEAGPASGTGDYESVKARTPR